MDFIAFIEKWGLWAVFLGSLVEGESVILTASAMAGLGIVFSLKSIMLTAFIGTVIADQGLFMLGRRYGENAVRWIRKKFPKTGPYIDKGFRWLERNQTIYLLIFRFIYGVRIVSPIIIGSRKSVPFLYFSVVNIFAAVLWVVVSCFLGYSLGNVILTRLDVVKGIFMAIVVAAIAGVWIWAHLRKKHRRLQEQAANATEKLD